MKEDAVQQEMASGQRKRADAQEVLHMPSAGICLPRHGARDDRAVNLLRDGRRPRLLRQRRLSFHQASGLRCVCLRAHGGLLLLRPRAQVRHAQQALERRLDAEQVDSRNAAQTIQLSVTSK